MKTRNSKLQYNRMNLANYFFAVLFIIITSMNSTAAKEINAIALSEASSNIDNTASIHTGEFEEEATLEFHEWMFDVTHFTNEFNIEADIEETLMVTDWMITTYIFWSASIFTADKETNLQLEKWMTDTANFIASPWIETDQEKVLEVESWMTNDYSFNSHNYLNEDLENPQHLEGWMLNDKIFGVTPINITLTVEYTITTEMQKAL